MKSQAAFEFLTIVGIGMIILSISAFYGLNSLQNYKLNMQSLNAQSMINSIVASANSVYSQGIGSRTRTTFETPADILVEGTYFYKGIVNVRLTKDNPTDVTKESAVNLHGIIPLGAGPTAVYVKMKEDGAHVYYEVSDLSYVGIFTYNDSTHQNEKYDFSTGDTLYYVINTTYLNESSINATLTLIIFKPDGTNLTQTINTVYGTYESSIVLDQSGFWQIAALPSTRNFFSSVLVKVT